MDELLPWLHLSEIGPWGLLVALAGFFVWSLATGRIIPRWLMRQITDRQQEALESQQETIREFGQTMPQILEFMRTNNHALHSIQQAAEVTPSRKEGSS